MNIENKTEQIMTNLLVDFQFKLENIEKLNLELFDCKWYQFGKKNEIKGKIINSLNEKEINERISSSLNELIEEKKQDNNFIKEKLLDTILEENLSHPDDHHNDGMNQC